MKGAEWFVVTGVLAVALFSTVGVEHGPMVALLAVVGCALAALAGGGIVLASAHIIGRLRR